MAVEDQVALVEAEINNSLKEYRTKKDRAYRVTQTLGGGAAALSFVLVVVNVWPVDAAQATALRMLTVILSTLIGALSAYRLRPQESALTRTQTQGELKDLKRAFEYYLARVKGGTIDSDVIDGFLQELTAIRRRDTAEILRLRRANRNDARPMDSGMGERIADK